MNYLGHFILSYQDNELLAGNFIADFVKGNRYKDYPEGISRGILMHRFIDEFTDTHEASMQCKALLRPVVGKLSGVALDILYDHILAKNFSSYTDVSLQTFAGSCYIVLSTFKKQMPLKGRYVFYYMKQHNWLCRYESAEGIQTTLRNMSRRIAFKNNLMESYELFREHEQTWISLFDNFFASLKHEIKLKYGSGL